MADLISLSDAQTALGQSLPTDQSWLPTLVTAACAQIKAYCKRDFVQQSYVELQNGKGFSAIQTRQYPVNSVTRLAVSWSDVLTVSISNVNATRATAALATTGDESGGFTVTGLTLTHWAAGAANTASIAFTANETVLSVAQAIRATSGGWQATIAGGDSSVNYAQWPAADFLPVIGAQSCTGGGTATFQMHTQDVSNYTVNPRTGDIRLNNQTFDPVFALMNLNAQPNLAVFPPGWQNIRIEYNAGYATIPPAVVQAALVTVKTWIYELQTITGAYDRETDDAWSYQIATIANRGLPEVAKQILGTAGMRSFRSF